ncbi:MAG TPA: 50S ribosomal protein L11 methyltransferase [Bryobacteraceae bacterium]|nr:50S ribosomal protein L11 methyltransferase [Bryobacteraceae bacterium]
MFSIELECDSARKDVLIAELWEAGSAGIVELDSGGLRAFFDDDLARAALADRFRAVSWRQEEQRDWVAESRAGFEPLAVGRRFFLVPEWRADPAPDGRFRIVVNPGMAFGTGRHETTQLCLEALETYLRPGTPMLDVGTGCGILAHAAALLGARAVYACDIDPEAVAIARGMAGPNVFTGSVDAVRSGSAELIAANISPEAIVALASDLMRCLAPDGVALVSGFERQEMAMVEAAFAPHGGVIRAAQDKGTWALLVVGVKLDGGAGHVDEQKAVS